MLSVRRLCSSAESHDNVAYANTATQRVDRHAQCTLHRIVMRFIYALANECKFNGFINGNTLEKIRIVNFNHDSLKSYTKLMSLHGWKRIFKIALNKENKNTNCS